MKSKSEVVHLPDPELIHFKDAEAFDKWLSKNYQRQEGVWMKMAKKSSGIPSITSDEAVDIGLCWGWISGIRRSIDDNYYLQKYVPRRYKSIWSQVNVAKVEKLIAEGKMQPSGLLEVEEAKADGRWQKAYASQKNVTIPNDIAEALKKNKKASETFEAMNKTERYQLIMQLEIIRTSEGRTARLKKVINDLSKSRKP